MFFIIKNNHLCCGDKKIKNLLFVDIVLIFCEIDTQLF